MAIHPVPPPDRGIVRPAGVRRPFRVTRWAPDGPVAEHIAYYWQVIWTLPPDGHFVQHTLPDPVAHVVFEDGQAELVGPMSRRFRRELRGPGGVLGVAFRPAVLRAWWTEPIWKLRDQRLPVSKVWGAAGRALARELGAVRPGPTQAVRVDRWLGSLGSPPRLSTDLQRLRDLVSRMQTDRTLTSVAQVAGVAGVSPRTLQRRFKDAVGWSPAEVLRRRRIQDALARLDVDPQAILSDLAHELGYCDQAHFCRDFRATTGMSPSAYVAC